MPSLSTRNSAPTVATDVVNLPPDFPEVPADVLKRFPSLNGWEEEVGNFWTKARQVLTDGIQSHSNAIAKIKPAGTGNLRVLIDDLQAAVTAETVARIAGDTALAASISSVVASVGTKSRISVQSLAPSSPAINDLWLDTSDQNRYKFWDGFVWQYKQDLVLAAAVSTESIARATADGFLEGKYTLTVVAGNVITGMNITSSTGGGTNVSSVIFRATDFLIYNSVTGVPMFTVSGTAIKLGATLTVDTANSKVYIGTGTYANTNTSFYVDSAGKFSLKDQLTWDGTTLSISGSAVTTVDWSTQVTGRPTELTDGRITTALNSAGLVISGAHPGINVTTGSAGLYMGADFMGYYNGTTWKTYTDNTGKFYLGGTSGALQWNGTTLSITGNINVTSISGLNYAGSASAAGPATTIVGQGALATQNTANYNTQLTNQPTNTAGALLVTVSPSGSGLFLGADHLGYYAGGAWKTYMDNSGNFYLGGTSGSLQWNGTTLTINGGGTFSGALSAATGSFSGAVTATSGTIGGFTIGATTLTATNITLDNTGFIRLGTSGSTATVQIDSGQLDFHSGVFPFDNTGSIGVSGTDLAIFAGATHSVLVQSQGNVELTAGYLISPVTLLIGSTFAFTGGSITTDHTLSANGLIITSGAGISGATDIVASGDITASRLFSSVIGINDTVFKSSQDGWTPILYTGDLSVAGDKIEFQIVSTKLWMRVNGGSPVQVTF